MEKTDFDFLSADGKTRIYACEWRPEGEVRAVLQIVHGMVEFIGRYEGFAAYLAERGICVVGHDLLGHGHSVTGSSNLGFFAEKKEDPGFGNRCQISDIHTLRTLTEKKYPQMPYFMMGHSMGSFLVQQYVQLHGEGLTGLIVMGTGCQPGLLVRTGRGLCRLIAGVRGWRYRSRLIDGMALGAYNKAFEPARTPCDWLTRDEAIVDRYLANPWNTFRFTLNAYYNMFRGIEMVMDDRNIRKIPRRLPVFFVSGEKDPVGNFGKGPRAMAEKYRRTGHGRVSLKLYQEDRHEILNELDREVVYGDLFTFLDQCLNR